MADERSAGPGAIGTVILSPVGRRISPNEFVEREILRPSQDAGLRMRARTKNNATPNAAEDVAWYIWMNPVRRGLCREPREFRFSGSFTLPWRSKKSGNSSWTPPWKRESRNDLPG